MLLRRLVFIWFALLICLADQRGSAGEPVKCDECNGSVELCDRRYDDVSYATTHNAMSCREEGWLGPNQTFGIMRQLQDGIRGLMLDVHRHEGEPFLAHGRVAFGKKPLVDGLREIAAFLGVNRCEVVTIIFESYVTANEMAKAFADANLLRYAHVQVKGEPWPTLREMVDSDKRLVVFTDREEGRLPWYHDVWDFCWETHFSAKRPEDFSTRRNRGADGNDLFILNHFLTNPIGSPKLAEQVNHNPFLLKRAEKCRQAAGQLPNFVTVDFYEIGDVLAVVKTLNGLD